MSRFNGTAKSSKITNLAGGTAYAQSLELEFVSILLTSFVQDQYHRSADDTMSRVKELIGKLDPIFVAKAAIFARTEIGMRSISHVVAGELGNAKGHEWTKRFYDKIVYRPDDMCEILAYVYGSGKKETNPMRKGFATALERMSEYHLAKYRGEGKAVSLVDVVNIVHPKETPAIKALVDGTLKPADTWEVLLSAAGSDEAKRAAVWEGLLRENKLGYFALLRNLRNIMVQAPASLDLALEQLVNEKAVKKSLVLPFRFFTAYQEFVHENGPEARKIAKALGKALDISVSNMPDFGGNSLVVVDHSGSMDSNMSDKSKATMFQIGALFGVALAKKSNADLMYFGDDAKYYNVTEDSTLSQIDKLESLNNWGSRGQVGHGTNMSAVFQEANRAYDRVFIFSDMQTWRDHYGAAPAYHAYNKRLGANAKIYSFDLAGYGSIQFPENGVATLAGFSDKILDILKLTEENKDALVERIKDVEL